MTVAVAQMQSRPIMLAAFAAIIVAVMGGLATDISGWYETLQKPAWQPPDWLFAPVWTAIYGLTAISGAMAWTASRDEKERQNVLFLWFLNAFLNVLWSLLFFRLYRPDLALWEVSFLWSSIILMIFVATRRRMLAALLLVPYLAWVSFAAVLNAEVVRLNEPFIGM